MTTSSFYDRPDLYDLVMTSEPRAEAFYIAEARRRGGAVLDLACGSGRMTIPLAQVGLDVVGVDESPVMLAAARAKAAAVGVQLELVRGDMRELDMPPDVNRGDFGLVVIFANSLLHLHEAADIRRCLRAVARRLRPGGALAFDVFTPNPRFFFGRPPHERREIGRYRHAALGELTLEETTSYDPALQISRATWFWSAPGQADFFAAPLHLRHLYPQELPLLLELEGFRLAQRYGDFDRRPFDASSPRQVCVCERV